MDDVLINKISVIDRCLKRIKEVYTDAGIHFQRIILDKIRLSKIYSVLVKLQFVTEIKALL
jgi:hypothetical protein